MALTFTLLALVPLSVISLNGLDNISDVATISPGAWRMGLLLSQSVCAVRDADLLLGTGRQLLTNIFDQFRE